MNERFLVCDGERRMPTLEVKMFGAVRPVLVIFTQEQDALEVGAAVEQLSGRSHQVVRVGDDFEVTEL